MTPGCSSCGAELPQTAKFCRRCGTRAPIAPRATHYGTTPTCGYCGTGLLNEACFCHACGRSVGAASAHEPATGVCPSCGGDLDQGARVCRHCGWLVDTGSAASAKRGVAGNDDPPQAPVLGGQPDASSNTSDEAAARGDEDSVGAPADDAVQAPIEDAVEAPSTVVRLPRADVPVTVAEFSGDAVGEEREQATVASPTSYELPSSAPVQLSCRACQTFVSDTARFCRSCGAELDQTEATVIGLRPTRSTCPHCQSEVVAWASFCRHCGAVLSAP